MREREKKEFRSCVLHIKYKKHHCIYTLQTVVAVITF